MIKQKLLVFILINGIILLIFLSILTADPLTIALVKYPQGDDWYEGKSALANFLENLKQRTSLDINTDYPIVEIDKDNIYQYPILMLNGHGRINLNLESINILRDYLIHGGCLIINDDYGLEYAVRGCEPEDECYDPDNPENNKGLVDKLFPDQEMILLPNSHEIFHCYFNFPEGLPKIHEHDNKPAQLFAIIYQGKIVLLYIYNSDIMDGWEVEGVHNDPPELRNAAINFGINMVYYILSQ